MLEVQGLVKYYGARCVVDGVDFKVEQGEIVGLLGPNGAGKTTSFRMTCGMIEPNQGKVVLNNLDVTRWPMYRRAREGGMGYLAQESSVFRKLTVEKNLLGIMELLGMDRKTRYARCDELLDQFDSFFDVLKPSTAVGGLSDAEVGNLIAERTAAKKARDFARADGIRGRLLEQGIILEDTKDGIRWKRK